VTRIKTRQFSTVSSPTATQSRPSSASSSFGNAGTMSA
jgi:hypothetical protein